MRVARGMRWGIVAVVVVAVGILVFGRDAPIAVEVAVARAAPLRETVGDEGMAEVRHRHLLTAPVGGALARLTVEVGDTVAPGQVVAEIRAAPLDARARAEAEAALAALRDGAARAEAMVGEVQAAVLQAQRDRERTETLVEAGAVAPAELERLRLVERVRRESLAAARAAASAASHDVEAARAVLRGGRGDAVVQVRCPIGGVVLQVPEASARLVPAGEPLLAIGDPTALEVVVDLPSNEAMQVRSGMPMRLTRWGGDSVLAGRVRRVDPSAFTETSALGVTEQRVRVVGDFERIPHGLGDRFRLDVEVVTWEGDAVLQVPSSALFRHGEGWATFRVANGRAALRSVTIGHHSADATEVLDGLAAGDTVVRYPGNRLVDGGRIKVQ